MDAPRLTAWRTAAASALASRYLSRADASRHAAGRRRRARRLIWCAPMPASARSARSCCGTARAPAPSGWPGTLAGALPGMSVAVAIADDLEAAVRGADIVSTATISTTPLVARRLAQSRARISTASARSAPICARPTTRWSAARGIWVDTRAGGFAEAGDIVIPLAAGVISARQDRRRSLRPRARHRPAPRLRRTTSRCSSRSAPRSRIWPRPSPCTSWMSVRLSRRG